ncbi:hypothetical protein ACJZ2D_000817 [Fusarium nematophilum]
MSGIAIASLIPIQERYLQPASGPYLLYLLAPSASLCVAGELEPNSGGTIWAETPATPGLCVGQRRPQDKDESVILFVKLHPGITESKSLKIRLLAQIEKDLSRWHMPKYVFNVPSIPYTVNGKKMETLVRYIVSGRKTKSYMVESLESISSFEKYYWVEQEAAKEAQLGSKL